MAAVALVVVLAGWAVPLLFLAAEVVVVEGWSKVEVRVVVGGAGVAGNGDVVLDRCKPL